MRTLKGSYKLCKIEYGRNYCEQGENNENSLSIFILLWSLKFNQFVLITVTNIF